MIRGFIRAVRAIGHDANLALADERKR
jgi:hypothetical protein